MLECYIFVRMRWEDYLISKKIDSELFKKEESVLWETWKKLFEQMHPNSFTAQKLYLINPIRRKYPLSEDVTVEKEPLKKPMVKPKLLSGKPKMVKPKPVFIKRKTD